MDTSTKGTNEMTATELRDHMVEHHGWSETDARNVKADKLAAGHDAEHAGPNSLIHEHE